MLRERARKPFRRRFAWSPQHLVRSKRHSLTGPPADISSASMLSCPARRHRQQNVPKTWVTTSCRTGCRGVARFSAPGRSSRDRSAKARELDALIDRLPRAAIDGGAVAALREGLPALASQTPGFSPATFACILRGFAKGFQTHGFSDTSVFRQRSPALRFVLHLIFIAAFVFTEPGLAQKLVDPNSVAPEFRDAAEKTARRTNQGRGM